MKSKKVTKIEKTFPANDALISMLEHLLNEAKNGVILSMVGVTERFDGATCEYLCSCETSDLVKIIGSLSIAKSNIIKKMGSTYIAINGDQ